MRWSCAPQGRLTVNGEVASVEYRCRDGDAIRSGPCRPPRNAFTGGSQARRHCAAPRPRRAAPR